MIPLESLPALQKEKPIFVLGSSQRTGSTLLQRLLNSCPRVMIWGEHLAHLSGFFREFRYLRDWENRHADERKTFLLEDYDIFAPNIMPEEYELVDAARIYIAGLFGIPAAKLGRPIWGFKEVRYGAQVALFLQECFPQARFIHLTRNPVACFLSMKRLERNPAEWDREWTETAISNWAGINETFLNQSEKINHLLQVKFEEMVAEPPAFMEKLSTFLDIPEQEFEANVFKKRMSWDKPVDQGDRIQDELPAHQLDEKDRAFGEMITWSTSQRNMATKS
jgi:hypothetical protein